MEVKPLKDELKLRKDKVTSAKEVVREGRRFAQRDQVAPGAAKGSGQMKGQENEAQNKLSDAERSAFAPLMEISLA
jgi:hypothetical protein